MMARANVLLLARDCVRDSWREAKKCKAAQLCPSELRVVFGVFDT